MREMKRTVLIFNKMLQSAHKNEPFRQSSMAFFVCLLAVVLLYRIQLTMGLFTNPVRPFDFNPTHYPVWFILAYWPYDLALVLIFFLLSWLLSRISYLTQQSRMSPIFKISEVISLHVILFVLLLIHGVHGRLLFDVQTGLDASAIKEAFSGISLMEIIKLID